MKKANSEDLSFSNKISDGDRAVIEDEARILDAVLVGLLSEQQRALDSQRKAAGRMENLKEEAGSINLDDLPVLFDQLHNQWSLAASLKKTSLPGPQMPYFARMQLTEGDKVREVLVGYRTFISTKCDYPIIDWRSAPAAKIFFNHSEGDAYTQQLPKRLAKGIVSKRHVVAIKDGVLQSITTPEKKLVQLQGTWTVDDGSFLPELAGGQGSAVRGIRFGSGRTRQAQADIRGLLDQTQFALLNAESDQSLLILGGAGSGKTTVALHRLSILNDRDAELYNESSMLILVPDQGLQRLCRNILKFHELSGVPVETYDSWISSEGRRLFRNLPKRLCQETPGTVIKIKRHPLFLQLLHTLVEKKARAAGKQIAQVLKKFPVSEQKWLGLKPGEHLEHWLSRVLSKIKQTWDVNKSLTQKLNQTAKSLRSEWHDTAALREELLLGKELLANLVSEDITQEQVEKLVRHSRSQLFADLDIGAGSYDKSRKMAVDGLDEEEIQSEQGLYRSIDVEDYSWLFYLRNLIWGSTGLGQKGKQSGIHHMVLDEAQELCKLERKVLATSLTTDSSVSIAGDLLQQTKNQDSFNQWDLVLEDLGIDNVHRERLTTNYRSTAEVADFAQHVLGDLAIGDVPEASRRGMPVLIHSYANYGEALINVSDVLRDLCRREPQASVAVILKTEAGAKKFFEELHHLSSARLVLKGDFSFNPGIDVTTADQIKGLEFDYVVLPDVDQHVYPDEPLSRKLLHVAATRAIHQLWVVSSNRKARIIEDYKSDSDRSE